MSWAFQGVANACIQILLLIYLGYLMTWKGVISDKFLPQINSFLMMVAYPALNLTAIGINLDLYDTEGWRSIGAYIMWIGIIQICILVYVWFFAKKDVGEAALLNMLLAANNTVIIGLPIMDATWGTIGRYVSLLTTVPLFIQIFPFSITLFEIEKWMLQQAAGSASTDRIDNAGTMKQNDSSCHTPDHHHANDDKPSNHLRESTQLSEASHPAQCTTTCNQLNMNVSVSGTGSAFPNACKDDVKVGMGIHACAVESHSSDRLPAIILKTEQEELHTYHQQVTNKQDTTAGTGQQHRAAWYDTTHAHAPGPQQEQDVCLHSHEGSKDPQDGIPDDGSHHVVNHDPSDISSHGHVQPGARNTTLGPQHSLSTGVTASQHTQHGQHSQRLDRVSHCEPHRMTSPGLMFPDTSSLAALAASGDIVVGSNHTHAGAANRSSGNTERMMSSPLPITLGNPVVATTSAASPAVHQALLYNPVFSDQWRAYLRHFQELKQRRRDLKKQQRSSLSVVDVPLPVSPSIQLGRRLADQVEDEPLDTDLHDPGGLVHDLPTFNAVVDEPTQADAMRRHTHQDDGASEDHNQSDSQGQHDAWATEPQGLFQRLLSHSKNSLSHITASFSSFLHIHRHNTSAAAHRACAGNADRESRSRQMVRVRSVMRSEKVQRALKRALTKHGGLVRTVSRYMHSNAKWMQIAAIVLKNPMLVSLVAAMLVSLSGLRKFLDPKSPLYVVEAGWLVQMLTMLNNTTVPLALFSNGVFLYGKRFWEGNMKKALVVLALKILALPALQLACAKVCGLSAAAGMALVQLSVAPCASASFVLATQYQHGAEVVTMVTVALTLLLVPLQLAALNLPKLIGVYDFDSTLFPLP